MSAGEIAALAYGAGTVLALTIGLTLWASHEYRDGSAVVAVDGARLALLCWAWPLLTLWALARGVAALWAHALFPKPRALRRRGGARRG